MQVSTCSSQIFTAYNVYSKKDGWKSVPHTDKRGIKIRVENAIIMKNEDVATSQSNISYQSQTRQYELDRNGSPPLSDPLYRLFKNI